MAQSSNHSQSMTILAIHSGSAFPEQLAASKQLPQGMISFGSLDHFSSCKQVFAEKSFDQVILYLEKSEELSQPVLNSIVKVLKPGNSLRISLKAQTPDEGLEKRFKLAGLVDLEHTSPGTIKVTRKVWKTETIPTTADSVSLKVIVDNPGRGL